MNKPSFDLIVIGAGINGAGIARDATMRGLHVLLLDKSDIGSGTSSWSTRLIHGGLRYLEHWEFGLVRESLRERENLLRIAPHLVRPIPILIPIYKGGSRGRATIRIGMVAYDLLSFDKSLPRHRLLSRTQTLEKSPGLNPEGLIGGALYYDCQVEFAERLVVENVLSAKEHRATVLTYATVTKINADTVEFIRSDCDETEMARATAVINATGPWVDRVVVNSGVSTQRLIGGTKGSHVVVRSFNGAPPMAIYVEAESDRRPIFVIPWNSNYLIGTTDVRFEDNPDQVRSELWEVDYLLKEANRIFPAANLSRRDVSYTYSGVRPLPFTKNAHEANITRRHFIRELPQNKNVLSIVGGKLTTYRQLAEECVDLICRKLGKGSSRCKTALIPLPGAVDLKSYTSNFRKTSQLPTPVNERLLRIYGSRISELLQLCAKDPALAATFNKRADALAVEIVFGFQVEEAKTLADCLLRRTMIGLNDDLAIGDDEAAAEVGKRFLGWSEQRVMAEVLDYRARVKTLQLE
jgi:glycerol-3-phosphate dehydrogenase